MGQYPKYIKAFATLANNKNTLAGPDNSANGVLVNIYEVVQEGINNADIDVTPDLGDIVVTTTDNQTVTGNKTLSGTTTLSGATTISGVLVASNAAVSLSAIPTYADNAAALSGGLAAGRLYKTDAGGLNIVVPA